MTNKEFIVAISKSTGFTQRDIKTVIESMRDVVIDRVKNCDEVKLMSGITVYGSEKAAHTGRNPQTGETVEVPAKVQLRVKVGAPVKKAIN